MKGNQIRNKGQRGKGVNKRIIIEMGQSSIREKHQNHFGQTIVIYSFGFGCESSNLV